MLQCFLSKFRNTSPVSRFIAFSHFALAELDWIDKGERFELMASFFFLLSSWLYFAYMESSARQATWGKYWLGLKVLNTQQEQISFGKASLRHLGRVACFFTLYVGFLIVFFTAKRQTLADIIAQTLVIKR